MTLLAWIGVLFLSFTGAGAAFLLVYFLWMRRFNRRLFETQVMLYKIAALFQKAQKGRPASGRKAAARRAEATEGGPAPGAIPRITVSVEGRSVEIVEVGGQEVVRVEGDDLTEAQRSRILAYLRDEGFIS